MDPRPILRDRFIDLAPRSDGARYRRVSLSIAPRGELVLSAHETGAAPEAAWGLDDDEVTLTVAAEDVARLALALAAEVLRGGSRSVERLAALCEASEIPCRIARWT